MMPLSNDSASTGFPSMQTLRLPLFLVASALLLLWLIGRAGRDAQGPDSAGDLQAEQDYDYFVSAMRSTGFSASGEPTYHLTAGRVTHYPEGDIAILEAPDYTRIMADGAPWQATARQGTLSPDPVRNEERLELQGDVLLHQGTPTSPLVARADHLTVYPASEEAATDAEVILDAPGTRLESSGMKAFMAQDKIELSENVRGIHAQDANE